MSVVEAARPPARPRLRGGPGAPDAVLVARLRGGDELAFEAIFHRHQPPLLSFCRHMLGGQDDAEDALQQTFIRAHRALRSDSPPRELRPWLYTIARNCCLTAIASRRASTPLEDHPQPSLAGLAEEVRDREDLRELVGDLQALPPDQRSALLLAELEDLPHQDIAAIVDCPVKKVRALIHQARTTLIAQREARAAPCQEIRVELSSARAGELRRGPLRRHLNLCPGCRDYAALVRAQRRSLAAVLPVLPSAGLAASILGHPGVQAGASGIGAAAGGHAAAALSGAGPSAGLAAGGAAAGGAAAGSAGALATGATGSAGTGAALGGGLAAKLAIGGAVAVIASAAGATAIHHRTAHHPAPARAARLTPAAQHASPAGRAVRAPRGFLALGATSIRAAAAVLAPAAADHARTGAPAPSAAERNRRVLARRARTTAGADRTPPTSPTARRRAAIRRAARRQAARQAARRQAGIGQAATRPAARRQAARRQARRQRLGTGRRAAGKPARPALSATSGIIGPPNVGRRLAVAPFRAGPRRLANPTAAAPRPPPNPNTRLLAAPDLGGSPAGPPFARRRPAAGSAGRPPPGRRAA